MCESEIRSGNILLSICIPTFNRAKYLRKALESISNQKGLLKTDKECIEILISDNGSDDDTEQVVNEFIDENQDYTISYYKQKMNIGAVENHIFCFRNAKGMLRKLSNDTVVYGKFAFKYIISAARLNIERKPIMFFSNGRCRKYIKNVIDPRNIVSLDDFILRVSYQCTWIGSISLWDIDCSDMMIYFDNKDNDIPQVNMLFWLINRGREVCIMEKKMMKSLPVKNKSIIYGLYKVFYCNYTEILKNYLQNGSIRNDTFEFAIKDILFSFFVPWIITLEKNDASFLASDTSLEQQINKEYRNATYYSDYQNSLAVERKMASVPAPLRRIIRCVRRIIR